MQVSGWAVVICHHGVGYRIRPQRPRSLGRLLPLSKIGSLEDLREAGDPVLLANGEMRFGVLKGNSRFCATIHHSCHTRMVSLAPKASLESFVWVFIECVVGGLSIVSSVILGLLTSLGALENN